MRIISGRYKGRRLQSFDLNHIRPTTDRVKETLFNKLMFQIEGAAVLDLFSGTGNLGLEALSRGAGRTVFVDNHKSSVRLLQQNLELLKVPAVEYSVSQRDVFKYLADYTGDAFQIIFADPPFTQKLAHEVVQAVAQSHTHQNGTILAIEASRHEHIEDGYPPFKLLDRRVFGDKNLSLYESEGALPR